MHSPMDEPRFTVFSGRAYKLSGETTNDSPPRDHMANASHSTRRVEDSQEMGVEDSQAILVDSDTDSVPSTIGAPMSGFGEWRDECGRRFAELVDRINNVQVMLASYEHRLEDKAYASGFLQQIERMTYHNAAKLSHAHSTLACCDPRMMDLEEIQLALEHCERNALQSEKDFAKFKPRVLQFLGPDEEPTMETTAKAIAADDETKAEASAGEEEDLEKLVFPKKRGRRLRSKTPSCSMQD